MALFVKRGVTKTNIDKEQELNSQIWATGILGQAHSAKPVMIKLKDPINFLNRKQYPINSETKIITMFLGHELLVVCNSLFNILILPIREKKNGTYRLVQDSSTINEVIIPIHTVVPNPYTIMGQIPSQIQWFSVLDLKDTFFCISSGFSLSISICF